MLSGAYSSLIAVIFIIIYVTLIDHSYIPKLTMNMLTCTPFTIESRYLSMCAYIEPRL